MMVQPFVAVLFSFLVLAPWSSPQASRESQGKGMNAFHFKVRTIDGDEINQDDFKEKVLLVDIWGTWCPPCRKAVPFLSRLYDSYKDRGLEIVGLNFERTSHDKALKKVRSFADRLGIPYQLALGNESILNQIKGFRGYPTLLFFKRGLVFDHLEVGFSPASKKRIEDWVKKVLDEVPANSSREAGKKKASQIALPVGAGRIFTIGDNEYRALVFIEHPKAFFPKAFKDHLFALIEESGVPTKTISLGRKGLGATPQAHLLSKKTLKSLRVGSAFPALVLYSKEGRVLYRAAGLGKEIEKKMAAVLQKLLVPKGSHVEREDKVKRETKRPPKSHGRRK